MRKSILYGCAIMALVSVSGASSVAWAGPWEDGMVAYNRGDYVPAIRLFRTIDPAVVVFSAGNLFDALPRQELGSCFDFQPVHKQMQIAGILIVCPFRKIRRRLRITLLQFGNNRRSGARTVLPFRVPMHLFVQIFAQDFVGIIQLGAQRQNRMAVRYLGRRHPELLGIFEAAYVVLFPQTLDAFDDLFSSRLCR